MYKISYGIGVVMGASAWLVCGVRYALSMLPPNTHTDFTSFVIMALGGFYALFFSYLLFKNK